MSYPATKTKRGRPTTTISDAQVALIRSMVADHKTLDEISAAVGIAVQTLRKHAAAHLIPPTPLLDASPVQPAPKRRRRKPKATKPVRRATTEERRRVALWIAAPAERISIEAMAKRLDMSVPTFRREFAPEIANAATHARLQLIERLNQASASGNVTATMKLLTMIDTRELDDLSRSAAYPVARAPVIGKKAAATEDAHAVADDPTWGLDLAPGIQRSVQ